MSEKVTFKAEVRTKTGKCANRQLRNTGMIPAVFYSQEGENITLSVNEIDFAKMFRTTGTTRLFSLDIDGKTYDTLVWKVQMDPVRPRVNHIDFLGVAKDKPLKIEVPVTTEGLAPGVKLGGRMAIYRDKLTVACTAATIPAAIVINVSNMNVGDTVFVNEVELGEGASIIFDSNFALVRCAAGRGSSEEEEGEEGEE
ncbi:50S ribosomal protein L25 [Maridesulfovibrio hydrothermalis]|uniref:Large ribosomal subunit protein bL25 n=1 Tax=Maridesulfovibrio hydrothermalis AM13 = DSM 14728 TaxID=1121451 RepID=L0RGQ3_9BACT|nr:50S ribosomal protein L25 [Maridesulfovibrio hydrothermalis]CCO25402.1 50S ribosomal protein L25 [Maridesulfovibrio hydrothermalis AM13 = DSM 14728]